MPLQMARPMPPETHGSIVAISTAGLGRFPPKDILSTAPKAAIEALISAIAREEGKHAIRANAVRVGVVDAGMFDRVKQQLAAEWLEAAKRNAALRRFGTAEEVANAVVFLASARASYITGQSLTVDGGYAV
jgi:NAD(P)-dependent dehydrogenase (short-subunit alcohol dehydrogenase family)